MPLVVRFIAVLSEHVLSVTEKQMRKLVGKRESIPPYGVTHK